MMHLFLNGLAASAGGGLTYLRNVIGHLSARSDVRTTVAIPLLMRKEMGERPNISFADMEVPSASFQRFWNEQTLLPQVVRKSGASVLVSAGNFALRSSPIPQILLSRNSLYTSADFFVDLHKRREYALWLDARLKAILAKRSIFWADRTVAPSHSFAEELHRWTGKDVDVIYHGFDREAFTADSASLPSAIQSKLDATRGCLRLLFVSHYNYYRNFETLFRALPRLQSRLHGREVRLLLTCKLRSDENPGSYRAESASALVAQLGVARNVVELGAVPYSLLHRVYAAADIYVTPAYAETFAHPLVEAMSSGLPIVASDLPVHREICQSAALYFSRFSPEELADQVVQIAESKALANEKATFGRKRCLDFSWHRHVEELLALAKRIEQKKPN